MGVTITATHRPYEFDMGYGGFFNLRKNIAFALDEEFGENYALLSHCFTESQFSENDKVADTIIKKKNLNPDIISFLYQPDTEGKISYKICKQIYDIIKDVDFKEKSFRYATLQHNDYEEFKLFLKDCYSHRKQMRWS